MNVTITRIADKEKISARTNKPFTSRGIQCNEYGERWLSGFAGKDNAHWKVGDTVEIDIVEKGEYLNFSVPKGTHQTVATGFQPTGDLLRVERKVDAIMTEVQMMRGVLGEILQKVKPILEEEPF